MKIKKIIQVGIKIGLDVFFLPLIGLWLFCVRFLSSGGKRNRVFFGLIANNKLIYVRDALKAYGYVSAVIPWGIPWHEKGFIKYDIDVESKLPYVFKNFLGNMIMVYVFFMWAVARFDIFVIPFRNRFLDRTFFLSWLEFQFLHFGGKKIILNPYGGDVQRPDVWECSCDGTKKLLLKGWVNDRYYSRVCTGRTRKIIKYGEKHADAVIASLEWPDYLSRIDYFFHMRVKPSFSEIRKQSNRVNKMVKIVHATNHPHFKGTQVVQQAVADINNEMLACELTIFHKTPNDVVLEEIANADIVFDQLLAGAYGRLAIEAMSLGKPVICYLRDDLRKLYPIWDECPIINANIFNVKEKILELINMSEEQRVEIGNKSKAYVDKYHSQEYVGERLHNIIQEVLKK